MWEEYILLAIHSEPKRECGKRLSDYQHIVHGNILIRFISKFHGLHHLDCRLSIVVIDSVRAGLHTSINDPL